MNKLEKLKENKILKVIMIIIKTVFVIFILAFIAVVYLQRFSNNKLSLFNFRMFTVISESMKPEYQIGDVLIAKEVAPATIKIGDDISYLGKAGDVKNKVVTHRVITIQKNNDKYQFYTQGLSNLVADPIVNEDQIYGKIVYKSGILSTVNKIIATKIGFYLCIIVPIAAILVYEIVRFLLDKEEKRRAKLN